MTPTPFRSMMLQQVSSRWSDLREQAGSRGSVIFSYSTTRFCSIRSAVVILYMAPRSILPMCSMYTGRPSWEGSTVFFSNDGDVAFLDRMGIQGERWWKGRRRGRKMMAGQSRERVTHLVGFVVVLRVVLKYLGLLLVIERPDQLVHAKVLSPLLAFYKPRADHKSSLSTYHLPSSIRSSSEVAVISFCKERTTGKALYIFFACSTLNFRARRKRSMDRVSKRSV